MGLLLFRYNRSHTGGTWSGMVALVRTVVGVSLVGGLLVVLLWSEQQVGVKTPAHTHFQAHARGIPAESGEDTTEKIEEAFQNVKEKKLQSLPLTTEDTQSKNKNSSKNQQQRVSSLSSSSSSSDSSSSPSSSSSGSKSKNGSVQSINQLTPKPEEKSSNHSSSSSSGNNSSHLVFNIDQSIPVPNSDMPKIYVITPTYRRPEQVAELTRLAQTLMLVPNLHWLVAEDSVAPTKRVLSFLNSCSVPHTYLLATASKRYKGANKPRGVSNRNAGLKWLKVHAKEGVFYFADDDNTYDYRVFQEIRWTKRVSMFPVGLVTRLGVSSPIVSDGKLIGFYDGWIAGRKFPVDMAGFAVNVQFYLQRNTPMMPYSVGFEEDGFLKALKIKPEEIEPLADNCTKILVWHTRTVKSVPALKMPETDKVSKTNLNQLKPQMVFQMPFGLS